MMESMLDDAAADDGPQLAFQVEPCDVSPRGAQPTSSGRRAPTNAAHGGLPTGDPQRRGAASPSAEGELRCGQARARVTGRTLQLIVWLATHQERINQSATESGQLWLTWKGDGPQSISGDIRTRL